MSRDVEVREFTALMPEDDEHEQQVKGEGWDDEEVDRDDVAGMSRQKDFLWFMSSDFLLTLPELVARHRRQVVLLVIRDLALPHEMS